MDKTNTMVESRKRKIKELTDKFEEIENEEILRSGIEDLLREEIEEIEEIEEGLLSQYFRNYLTITLVNGIAFVVFSEITLRVINKWK